MAYVMLFAVSGWHDVLLALLLIWIEAWQLELAKPIWSITCLQSNIRDDAMGQNLNPITSELLLELSK